ncbi:MAG TPA: prephenate dehydratase [Candidatus Thiothrix moscowensis]|uniref:prephenate dehydratase n=1 Tax=unclassified Thiothrix TaxID=2636184 RepID=UPI0025DEA753|nr:MULTISPECIES: prephenate dehydratase [unclassified Thiothrix]HRJ53730.1 prephenate dehydratase [Candidatus Thiothrix moscowensis]HRJ93812.1 prephenate dehydratase [Candidatus Thiothrix moscowensis]
MSEGLAALRERIDTLDTQILELLNARARCAEEVAHIKLAEDPNAKFYRPEREAQILARMQALNEGPLRNEQITHLFREIIASCLALEESMRIAYLGPAGTFTQEATFKHFGMSVATLPVDSIPQVFREVEAGRVRYGVVPIENSTEGVVNHTLDMFVQSGLRICGEVSLRIHQNLMCLNADWRNVQKVYAHVQSLAQCRYWLDKHLPQAERIPVSSNAEAARLASLDACAAAIGSRQAAPIYGLQMAQESIEDNPNNTTRFLIIGDQTVSPSGNDRTSLLVSTRNQPGSLYHLLKPLAENGVDMTRIESRPSKTTNWEYLFFLDVRGHEQDAPIRKALDALRSEAEVIRVLGSYPVAIM